MEEDVTRMYKEMDSMMDPERYKTFLTALSPSSQKQG